MEWGNSKKLVIAQKWQFSSKCACVSGPCRSFWSCVVLRVQIDFFYCCTIKTFCTDVCILQSSISGSCGSFALVDRFGCVVSHSIPKVLQSFSRMIFKRPVAFFVVLPFDCSGETAVCFSPVRRCWSISRYSTCKFEIKFFRFTADFAFFWVLRVGCWVCLVYQLRLALYGQGCRFSPMFLWALAYLCCTRP